MGKKGEIFMKKVNTISKILNLSFAIICLGFSSAANADNPVVGNNPVLAGDFPDPSIVRAGNNYWATTTSAEWAPEFPIAKSTNLLDWTITGSVFKSRPGWTSGNFWAPEISYYKNKYYVYYTARKKDGSLCIGMANSEKPDSDYQDHGAVVCQDDGAIDPMAIVDKDGSRYLVWKEDGNSKGQPTPIWAQKLSEDGTKLTGQKVELIRNDPNSWEGNLVEAPFIMKRNNMYYMFYSGNACCGNECNYAMGVARASSLLGPWEKNPVNPILTSNDNWRCPGHGSIVTDINNKNFLLYHAYNIHSGSYVGRQALIDEVKWGKDNWPVINNGNGPSEDAGFKDVPANKSKLVYNDEFVGLKLEPAWQWPQDNEPGIRFFPKNGGFVQISGKSNKDKSETSGLIAHSTTVADYIASTMIDLKTVKIGAMAGIAAYGDKENALGLSVKGNNLIVWKREKNNFKMISNNPRPKDYTVIYLKMTAKDGNKFKFEYSGNNKTWFKLNDTVDGTFLPPWDRGVRVALTVGGTVEPYASFGSFSLKPTS